MVEGNATGQMASLIEAHTGQELDHHIRRYDGRPFSPQYILAAIEEVQHG
jgi:2-oxoglutarate ferredoxin oxidoreductase subunit alpha